MCVCRPFLILALAITTSARADQNKAPEVSNNLKPNILIITADNLGYGDLRIYNRNSTVKTPNLDRLARQGARLTSFYTASPTCTVSGIG